MNRSIIVNIIILLGSICVSQCIVRMINSWFYGRLKKAAEHVRLTISPKKRKETIDDISIDNFKKELGWLYLIDIKKEKLKGLTVLIGVIEILLFGGLVFLYFCNKLTLHEQPIPYEIVVLLVTYAGGWIALKIFGNYQQWSGAVLGRASFYIFFICSIINIVFAGIIGWIATFLFL